MPIEILNPFTILIEVFEDLTNRTKSARVNFESPEAGTIPEGAKGVTIFPEDPRRPTLVLIRSDLPVWGALDIMAHELSHVAMGRDKEDHGPEWRAFYDLLYRTYCTVWEQKINELDARLNANFLVDANPASPELKAAARRAVESQDAMAGQPDDFDALAKSIVDSVDPGEI